MAMNLSHAHSSLLLTHPLCKRKRQRQLSVAQVRLRAGKIGSNLTQELVKTKEQVEKLSLPENDDFVSSFPRA